MICLLPLYPAPKMEYGTSAVFETSTRPATCPLLSQQQHQTILLLFFHHLRQALLRPFEDLISFPSCSASLENVLAVPPILLSLMT